VIAFQITATESTEDARIALQSSISVLTACKVPEEWAAATAEALLIIFADVEEVSYDIISKSEARVEMLIRSPHCQQLYAERLANTQSIPNTDIQLDDDQVCVSFSFAR